MKRTISAPDPASAPAIDWDVYEKFARDSLAALSAGEHSDAVLLRQQLSDATFIEMDYTGAGFFLTLDVNSSVPRLNRSGVVGDVHAEASEHAAPIGLMLFVKDGVASMLEAFAYCDWPEKLDRFRMQYVRWVKHADGKSASAENVALRDPASMWTG